MNVVPRLHTAVSLAAATALVMASPKDLTEGKLQALQVLSLAHAGQPIVFHTGQADADILSQDMQDLHTYGNVCQTKWLTIHNTDTDGTTPFDANALAKAAGATAVPCCLACLLHAAAR